MQSMARQALTFSILCWFGCAVALAQTQFQQIDEFVVPEANQGVGVDKRHFYAADNHRIAKYTKDGYFVAAWEGPTTAPSCIWTARR